MEKDVDCDLQYMKEMMPKVGKYIHEAYHWVDILVPICLYLDNVGGDGIQEVVDWYMKYLFDNHNIISVHQRPRPRTPVSNMLDLGA